jgi:DNA-directed RNA polymerase alpha subunit
VLAVIGSVFIVINERSPEAVVLIEGVFAAKADAMAFMRKQADPPAYVVLEYEVEGAAWRKLPIIEMELSNRSTNAARNNDYQTAGDLADASDADLLRLPSMGRKSVREIREVIAALRARP